MGKNDTPKNLRCSFCGKTQDNVRKISSWTRSIYM